MAVKLPDTLVPMADFPSAYAKDVQFTDGENLQDKLDNGKLGSSSSGTGLTSEQAQQLTTAYEHSQSTHVQISDIPTKLSQLNNDSSFVTTTQMNTAIGRAQLSGGSISNITYELFDDSLKSLFIIEEVK